MSHQNATVLVALVARVGVPKLATLAMGRTRMHVLHKLDTNGAKCVVCGESQWWGENHMPHVAVVRCNSCSDENTPFGYGKNAKEAIAAANAWRLQARGGGDIPC